MNTEGKIANTGMQRKIKKRKRDSDREKKTIKTKTSARIKQCETRRQKHSKTTKYRIMFISVYFLLYSGLGYQNDVRFLHRVA